MRLTTGLFIIFLLSAEAFAQQKTTINDKAAARNLLGRQLFSLQWISWDHFGTATVKSRRGVYYLKGRQKARGKSTDSVKIDGHVVSISAKEFIFDGTIVTQISHINGGNACTREGEMTFRITGKRKYWRLVEMDNPCDAVTDYVDIYLR